MDEGGIVDERVVYWTRDEAERNFGDDLSALFLRTLAVAPIVQADVFHLIGSVIDETIIRRELQRRPGAQGRIAFWCCGARSAAPLDPGLLDHCEFYGVRGPLTRQALGLSEAVPIGDPALLLPILHRPSPSPRTAGKAICIPHFAVRADPALLARSGADLLVSPGVRTAADLDCLIDDIAAADFVLSGSLHGAILACAYGRPFAFWDSGFVDIPFKWRDFAQSIGLSSSAFATDVERGRALHDRIAGDLRLPALAPILGCCPFAVRPSVLARALAHDAKLAPDACAALEAAASGLMFDRAEPIAALAHRERGRREAIGDRTLAGHRATLDAHGIGLLALGERLARLARDATIAGGSLAHHRLGPAEPELRFAEGLEGTAFLTEGWTEPNAIGPWSLAPFSRLTLPAGLGWEKASGLTISGLVFVPRREGGAASRTIWVWANDTLLLEEDVENGAPDQDTVYRSFAARLPDRIRAAGEHLVLTIAAAAPPETPVADDGRAVGVALMVLRFAFEAER